MSMKTTKIILLTGEDIPQICITSGKTTFVFDDIEY